MELRLPLEMSPGREAACRAVFGTWGSFRTMHGKTAPSRMKDEAERSRLQRAVEGFAVELLGVPLDEVVIVPPHSILKTSSGKIRRAATRDLYRSGTLGIERSVRMQLLHLAATGAGGSAAR